VPIPAITPGQFALLWIAAMLVSFVAAVSLRKAQGLPVFKPTFSNVEAQQSWRSGASSRGLMGSLAWVNNCLWFVLTRDALHMGAHFPFNLFMPRFMANLDLDIPLSAISLVEERSGRFRGSYLRVTYQVTERASDQPRTEYVDLRADRGGRFVRLLKEKVRARSTSE
jgi:hypothetical protein